MFGDYNIKDINIESLRDRIVYISQDIFLFSGTIRENLMLGNEDATFDEMLMYGKEASNRKQEIDRQHHTIPNQRSQRPKDKHCGNVHNRLWNHG